MECDRACGGDVIHCPKCCGELRIPFPAPRTLPGSIARAELLHPAASSPNSNGPPVQGQASEASPPAPSNPAIQPAEVTCPVCQSHLRIELGTPSKSSGPPKAELIGKSAAARPDQPSSKGEPVARSDSSASDTSHLSFEEREKQIAAAREARPIQLYPAQKPRLDYVLSGGAAPAKATSSEKPKHPQEHPPFDSFPE